MSAAPLMPAARVAAGVTSPTCQEPTSNDTSPNRRKMTVANMVTAIPPQGGLGEGRRQCSRNPNASTSRSGRYSWPRGQYLSHCEFCFRDAARGDAEPWVGLDRPSCRVYRFLVAILRKMSNWKPNVRGINEPVKRAQSDSAFAPLELLRPSQISVVLRVFISAPRQPMAEHEHCFAPTRDSNRLIKAPPAALE